MAITGNVLRGPGKLALMEASFTRGGIGTPLTFETEPLPPEFGALGGCTVLKGTLLEIGPESGNGECFNITFGVIRAEKPGSFQGNPNVVVAVPLVAGHCPVLKVFYRTTTTPGIVKGTMRVANALDTAFSTIAKPCWWCGGFVVESFKFCPHCGKAAAHKAYCTPEETAALLGITVDEVMKLLEVRLPGYANGPIKHLFKAEDIGAEARRRDLMG